MKPGVVGVAAFVMGILVGAPGLYAADVHPAAPRQEMQLALPAPTTSSATAPGWRVCFSNGPPGGCDPLTTIVDAIDHARREILVQAYILTSRPIVGALADARRRGLRVAVILDRGEYMERGSYRYGERSRVAYLARAGVDIFLDVGVRIAHNKVMIIDDRTVITGSFNFTESAERSNAENLLLINDAAVASRYAADWNYRRKQSVPLSGAYSGAARIR